MLQETVLETNETRLVEMAVTGMVSQPALRYPGYIPNNEGVAAVLPGMAGVVYNVRVGDAAFGWAADHVEPGVSVAHGDEGCDFALHYLTCTGNEVVVTSGLARGAKGVVTGEHARILIDFPEDARALLNVGDTVQIRACGRGLELTDYPHVVLKKVSPALFRALRIEALDERCVTLPVALELPIRVKSRGVGMASTEYPNVRFKSLSPELFRALGVTGDGTKLRVPVAATVPAHLLGAGAGLTSEGGSLHVQTSDREAVAAAGLETLRLGDLVVLSDYDSRYQHGYLRGAVGVAVVGQTDGPRAGYGPGLTLRMTAADGSVAPVVTPGTNLKTLLGLEA